jgi:hypothetical protein
MVHIGHGKKATPISNHGEPRPWSAKSRWTQIMASQPEHIMANTGNGHAVPWPTESVARQVHGETSHIDTRLWTVQQNAIADDFVLRKWSDHNMANAARGKPRPYTGQTTARSAFGQPSLFLWEQDLLRPWPAHAVDGWAPAYSARCQHNVASPGHGQYVPWPAYSMCRKGHG